MTTSENRPWGSFTVLEDTDFYKLKRLEVKPGHRLSLQSHEKRKEHWTVVKGVATVQLDDKVFTKKAGENIIIEKGQKHRLSNEGKEPVWVIEVQTGEYFGEDDIKRYEDDYKRE
jgi:mannose-1-phosphate guanylyltransferase